MVFSTLEPILGNARSSSLNIRSIFGDDPLLLGILLTTEIFSLMTIIKNEQSTKIFLT